MKPTQLSVFGAGQDLPLFGADAPLAQAEALALDLDARDHAAHVARLAAVVRAGFCRTHARWTAEHPAAPDCEAD